jgi:hypothetical protein
LHKERQFQRKETAGEAEDGQGHDNGMALTVLPYRDAAGGWGCTWMVASAADSVVVMSIQKNSRSAQIRFFLTRLHFFLAFFKSAVFHLSKFNQHGTLSNQLQGVRS